MKMASNEGGGYGERTVLPNKLAGGPLGLGDPNDRSLRKAEEYTFVRQILEKKAKEEKCPNELKDFFACVAREGSFKMLVKCRLEKDVMNNCLAKWFQDEEFKQQCRDEYINERNEFRRTGISAEKRRQQKLIEQYRQQHLKSSDSSTLSN